MHVARGVEDGEWGGGGGARWEVRPYFHVDREQNVALSAADRTAVVVEA